TPNHRLVPIHELPTFRSRVINEARIGYDFIRQASSTQEPVKASEVGISRANASTFPGLPLIRIAPNAGGIVFGTATANIDLAFTAPSATFGDTVSITRGKHSIRAGAEIIYYQHNIKSNQNSRGQIDFNPSNSSDSFN